MRSLISTPSWRAVLGWFGVVVSAFTANLANAVAVGEINLHSHLGEPLHATVALNHLGTVTAPELIVSQAQDIDYRAFGLVRPDFSDNLKFAVLVDPHGAVSVQITTDRVVSEPFIDVMMHLRWPNGHAIKQFSLLLDPPGKQ